VLSAAVIGIEAGFLLLYRAGGAVSTAYTASSAGTVALLLVIGTLWLREPINARQVLGLAFAVLGSWLVLAKR
jgi:multidrug transporter EmrE-like cation transporter